jgi:ABC-type uncharacterized transport system permease subunit
MILASAPPTSLILSILAASAYALPALRATRMNERAARLLVGLAWLLHGTVLSVTLLGEQPHFGFAPAMSVTAWLVAAVYAIESQIFPQLPTRWTLCVVGAATVMVAFFFPGTPIPATASAWLALHLAFGVACYGLFGIAVVHAWFMTRAEARIRHAKDPNSGLPLLTLERLTYRFVGAGYVLLSATLLAGFLFGDALYGHGHAWRWDHKTIFSMLAWLTFSVLLIGRSAFGWRGRRAVSVLYVGSTFLLLAYVGSRFVMEVILGRSA